MNNDFTLTRFYDVSAQELFRYFTQPDLLELWSAPTGMTLEVPIYEARENGKYHFIHRGISGLYNCTGYIQEFEANKKIVSSDHVVGPSGRVIHNDLLATIEFVEIEGATKVSISQSNFKDRKSSDECQSGWKDCLNQLEDLLEDKGQASLSDENFGEASQVF